MVLFYIKYTIILLVLSLTVFVIVIFIYPLTGYSRVKIQVYIVICIFM